MNPRARLGFVGLGLMGAPMTRRLLAQGWTVTVWNREPERYDETPGAQVADSPAAVRAAADIVLFCVLDAKAVENKLMQIVRINVVAGFDGSGWKNVPAMTQYAVMEGEGESI